MENKTSSNGLELKAKRKFVMPNTAALLMIMILFAAILTYIVPAGSFIRALDEVTGRTLVVADTYTTVEQSPVGFGTLLSSLFTGLVNASEIIAFVFIVGGAFGIISRTGAINSSLEKLISKFKGKETILIALIMTAFSIAGATFGMAEESLPFITILVAASIALGFNEIVGVAIVVVGIYCGYSAGPLNPFNTGIAQGIAQLPTFSGLGLRVVLMVGGLLIAIHHTVRYGNKIRKDRLDNIEIENKVEYEMTAQRKLILGVLISTIFILIFGVLKYEWYFTEISALFMAMGIVVGMIYYKGNFNTFSEEFLHGAGEMTAAAILIGLSRAILVVLESGQIMDTIVYWVSSPLKELNSVFAAWGMYIMQGLINFIIPSSTGQAVVVMPIMVAISDVIGLTRQVAVLAFQAGDGYWNMITPTHPVVMASLGLAGISFTKWFKFALPLVAKWTVWILIVLTIAVKIGWGPF